MQLCTTKYMHAWPKVLYTERERESELGSGQCYNSRTEKCLYCSEVSYGTSTKAN